MNRIDLIIRMYALTIWDRGGKQYLPLFGYNGEVEAYAPAVEAIDAVYSGHFDSAFAGASARAPTL